jgi:hypothetical protein
MATKKSASKTVSARKKASTPKNTSGKRGSASTAGRKASARKPQPVVGKDQYHSVQEKAYFLAEEDEFRGDPTHYWLEAQRQLEAG